MSECFRLLNPCQASVNSRDGEPTNRQRGRTSWFNQQEGFPFWDQDRDGDNPNATAIGLLFLSLQGLDLPQSRFEGFFRVYFKFYVPDVAGLATFRKDPNRTYYRPHDVKDFLPGQDMVITNAIESERVTHNFYGKEESDIFLVFHKKGEPQNILNAECRFKGTFKHKFDMRSFPADTQVLKIKMLMQKSSLADHDREWFRTHDVPDFDLEALSQPDYALDDTNQNDMHMEVKDGRVNMHFDVVVFRNPGFHALAATVPMTVIAVLTPISYNFDVQDLSSRVSHGLTLLLSAVAVKFVVAPDIPKVPYPTGLDIDTLLLYMYLLGVMCGQAYFEDQDEALSWYAHWTIPVFVLFLWRSSIRRMFFAVLRACGCHMKMA